MSPSRPRSRPPQTELRTGGPGAALGLIEIVDANLRATGSVTVLGSVGDQKGIVKTAKSTLSAGSDATLATGAAGVTEVKENTLSASRTVSVLAGAGGTCIAELNQVLAPSRRVCPPQ